MGGTRLGEPVRPDNDSGQVQRRSILLGFQVHHAEQGAVTAKTARLAEIAWGTQVGLVVRRGHGSVSSSTFQEERLRV
jgi:hypothetical protein